LIHPVARFLILTLALIGMPIVGTLFTEFPLRLYLEFPPRTQFISHSPFTWGGFAIFSSLILFFFSPIFIIGLIPRRSQRSPKVRIQPSMQPFPWWGWLSILCGVFAWIMAWTRFAWFAPFQAHTFTPLWLSFIVAVNAWTYHRQGHCLLIDRFGYFLGLFPVSALFWWFFEYLNRFVQNWYYVGVEFPAGAYFINATLAFATVLPAVLSVHDAVLSAWWTQKHFSRMPVLPMTLTPGKGIGLLLIGASGLLATSTAPDYFFPLLWVAPLLILLSLEILDPRVGFVQNIAQGDWREAVAAMLAALICGFFWEMWNYYSYAKWFYSVPWVQRFHLFEMPLLGYAGYLPFGWECLLVGKFFDMKYRRQ
jgi:hypothetical protein